MGSLLGLWDAAWRLLVSSGVVMVGGNVGGLGVRGLECESCSPVGFIRN